ncbi:MAG: acylaldehyde oxidase [Candidatus Rokubacteria bacterium 13_1_40CM_68_15]|nr:MAG: acylaldehyde oxidase [Candidatus Rokubacteria bacterium 13_1_40CM_68_15]
MSPPSVIGQPISRVDGRSKVTGAAKYAAEFDPGPRLGHGVVVTSTIAGGVIATIDTAAAETAAGVVAVLTHRNAPKLPYREHKADVDPEDGERLHVLQDDRVHHHGQPVALVVANTFEQATHGASLVRVTYHEEPALTDFGQAETRAVPPGARREDGGHPGETRRGNADAALAAAAVRVVAEYVIPREQHNPIELHATIAAWEDVTLTLWDKTQWVDNVRDEMAAVFGIPIENVRVVSPFGGGAFGSALRPWPHVTLAAMAARHVDRPVKIVLTRRQMYGSTGYRPHTVQRVALGAERTGRLVALHHEGIAETSTYEQYTESLLDATRLLYSCPNVTTRYRVAPMNVNTPTPMRAPGEASGLFALECAMDELAVALDMDPVQLRVRNDAERDEDADLPFSSRALRECFRVGAERFGWERRDPRPTSMRDTSGRLVGYGCASATYPVSVEAASARVQLLVDGSAIVSSAASDMGPGTYTSMTQVAAETLGLPLHRVTFELGDTRMPTAPVHGGSITMASVGSAVQAACTKARRQAFARAKRPSADLVEVLRQLDYSVDVTVHNEPDDAADHYSMHAFGAVFAEVVVDAALGTVRVPRIVGAYGAGRIINPKTAHSQAIGGMVMGIGMALLEHTVVDARSGRVVNSDLAGYLVPVNADVRDLEAIFVDEHDPHVNPLGVKGVAEITLVGVAAAIANAVHHATGRRVRELPITAEKLV